MHSDQTSQQHCANCGVILQGEYCQDCGQKRFADSDRRFGHLIAVAFEAVTDLDNRFWRTLRTLLFKPGELSRAYLAGQRARYYSPIGLFLFANILYFLAPALTDFNLPFHDQVNGEIKIQMLDPQAADFASRRESARRNQGQHHSYATQEWVERKLKAKQKLQPEYTMRDLARDYEAKSGDIGKALMIAHVPIFALLLLLANFWRRWYFAEHFVVALHFFTFLLLALQLVLLPGAWIMSLIVDAGVSQIPVSVKWLSAAVLLSYALLSCKKAYQSGWLAAASNTVVLIVGLFIANIIVYRALQFALTLVLI